VTNDDSRRILPGDFQWYLPLLGEAEAVIPTNDDLIGKSSALDDWLLTQENPTYMVKVNGNSMKEAAILDGDHVVVERTDQYKPGDIVIARIDGAWTIKHLRVGADGKHFLQAANDEHSKIHPSHELRLVAVVTAVIRRYRT
jgi:SOS-response transcriptional repressor LexA